jgi:transposase InsO family protein
MFNSTISSQGSPKYLSSDNDPLFLHHQWQANLRILVADEIKTIPYIPLSHPFVERLIGTIRREYLDQTLFWKASDLERKLEAFQQYYNAHRVHSSLDGDTLCEQPPAKAGGFGLRLKAGSIGPSADSRRYTTVKSSSGSGGF